MSVPLSKTVISPGFLPPAPDELDPDQLSNVVRNFCQGKRPLVTACGKVDWWEGTDLYGLDLIVELVARLKPDFPDIGVVVYFWDHLAEDQAYLNELVSRLEQQGNADHVLFNIESAVLFLLLGYAGIAYKKC